MPPSTIEAGLKNGAIKKFANLEALAKEYGINATELKSSLSRWNEAIASKKDPDFAAKIFDDTVPNEGSFYACRLWPRVHYCMGGLAINAKAEVLSTDLNVIPGLYAAGEVTGGVHGMVRSARYRSLTASSSAEWPGETLQCGKRERRSKINQY